MKKKTENSLPQPLASDIPFLKNAHQILESEDFTTENLELFEDNIKENIEYLEEYLQRLKRLEQIRLKKLQMLSKLSKSPYSNHRKKGEERDQTEQKEKEFCGSSKGLPQA